LQAAESEERKSSSKSLTKLDESKRSQVFDDVEEMHGQKTERLEREKELLLESSQPVEA